MKSIKEYNTSGMSLPERYQLLKKVIPIPIGEIVWDSGDCWSYPEPVTVTNENQKEITMFWNSLFFDNEEAATERNDISRGNYSSYQANAWR